MRTVAIAIPLRRAASGWQLFWVRRAPKLTFLGGFWAFPGGGVEPGDASLAAAAARELGEETGLAIPAGRFIEAGHGVSTDHASHYFLVELGDDAAPAETGSEHIEGEWTTAQDALARWDRGERLTSWVGAAVLHAIAPGGTLADIAGRLEATVAVDPARLVPLVPDFAMVALVSPTIPPATHTNCFIVGKDEVVVVDPGSPYPEEQAALDRCLEGKTLREIWVTHHHVDHVAGIEHLRARHRVPVAAHRGTAILLGDALKIDRLLEDGEAHTLGSRRLRAVFTPGHTMGHLCFLEETTRWVLAGDHVAGVGTVVIDPDEGDMAAYLESIGKLEALVPRALLPAHGPLITEPLDKLAEYRKHRLWRENRVLEELSSTARTAGELVPAVYRDVPSAMYGFAERSLRAHLIKLVREGRAVETEGRFMRR